MRLLFDTHTMLWWFFDSKKLSRRAYSEIGKIQYQSLSVQRQLGKSPLEPIPIKRNRVIGSKLFIRERFLSENRVTLFGNRSKVRLGKLEQARPLVSDYDGHLASQSFQTVPVTTMHALLAGSIASKHKDPFDRLMAAQAQAENIAVVHLRSRFRNTRRADLLVTFRRRRSREWLHESNDLAVRQFGLKFCGNTIDVQRKARLMIAIRKAAERGTTNIGWLDSKHSFSFGHYRDPANMGFGPLRVINDDRVAPGMGFGRHGHDNMEIISYVLDGALEHKDSIGTGSIIPAGDLQRMTAGTGVEHSEFNASKTEPVHFLQIWIIPQARGLTPSYEQKAIGGGDGSGLRLVGSPDGGDGAITIHQDVKLYRGSLKAAHQVDHALSSGRIAWVQMLNGTAIVNGHTMQIGDGVAIRDEAAIGMKADRDAEFLLFDMAA